jgi:AraC family transcriptional regulator
MDTHTKITLLPPTVENRTAMRFAGISRHHQMSHAAGIPAQWQQFQPWIGNIDGSLGDAAFGIVSNAGADCDDFEYIVAVQIGSSAVVPKELTMANVPAMRWARFTHSGDVTSLRSTIAAGADWLSRAGLEPSSETYSFLEYYGPKFDPHTGTGDVEVWFGLQD